MKRFILVSLAMAICLAFIGTGFAQDGRAPVEPSKPGVVTEKIPADQIPDEAAAAADKKAKEEASQPQVSVPVPTPRPAN